MSLHHARCDERHVPGRALGDGQGAAGVERPQVGPGHQHPARLALDELRRNQRERPSVRDRERDGPPPPETRRVVLFSRDGSTASLLVFVLDEHALADLGIEPMRGTPVHTQPTGPAFAALAAFPFDARRIGRRRSPSLAPSRLLRVLDLIEARLADRLTLDDLARAACLSPFHFSRLFRAATGRTPHRFLVEWRIAAAQAMLRERHVALVEVAMDAGFGSQATFTRAFRKITGLTPGQYRELHRLDDDGMETKRQAVMSATSSARCRNAGASALP